ncbi:MAG: hypothetical protein LBT09_13275, partial [Planctomycetaceae bacterium]|nr:hypothetical protein [Planctomycetaceae bacterium]
MTNSNFLLKIQILCIVVAAILVINVAVSDFAVAQQDQTLQQDQISPKKQSLVKDTFEPLPAGQVQLRGYLAGIVKLSC